jgi:hypothetical protein
MTRALGAWVEGLPSERDRSDPEAEPARSAAGVAPDSQRQRSCHVLDVASRAPDLAESSSVPRALTGRALLALRSGAAAPGLAGADSLIHEGIEGKQAPARPTARRLTQRKKGGGDAKP